MMITAIKNGVYKERGLPQFGRQDVGISPGGAMDQFSLATGNALLENPDHAPALEILFAPTLKFERDGYFILTGAQHEGVQLSKPPHDGSSSPVSHATVSFAPKGSILSFGKKIRGFRAYLCFRPVEAPLPGKSITGRIRGPFDEVCRWVDPDRKIRVVEGPEYGILDKPFAFISQAWKTTVEMDDMGMRLAHTQDPLAHHATSMVSEAVSDGTIQLTPKGPIILLRHRQTVGGYPRIFNVISVDMDLLAQYAPNQLLWFKKVTLEEARTLARIKHDDLKRITQTMQP